MLGGSMTALQMVLERKPDPSCGGTRTVKRESLTCLQLLAKQTRKL